MNGLHRFKRLTVNPPSPRLSIRDFAVQAFVRQRRPEGTATAGRLPEHLTGGEKLKAVLLRVLGNDAQAEDVLKAMRADCLEGHVDMNHAAFSGIPRDKLLQLARNPDFWLEANA